MLTHSLKICDSKAQDKLLSGDCRAAEKWKQWPFKHQVPPKHKALSSSYTQPNCAGKNHPLERWGCQVGGTPPVPPALAEGDSISVLITITTSTLFPGSHYPWDQIWKWILSDLLVVYGLHPVFKEQSYTESQAHIWYLCYLRKNQLLPKSGS